MAEAADVLDSLPEDVEDAFLDEEPEGPDSAGRGGPVLLRERYLIDGGTPLADLDSPSAKAYQVEDRRDPGRKLFALICTPGLPPRTAAMAMLKGAVHPGFLPLVEWDVVEWAPLGQRCMVVIYERPEGGRVWDAILSKEIRISEYDLPRRIIEPLCTGLSELAELGIRHRSIRVTNLFFMDEEHQQLVLGESTTTPPGFDQPMVFEPVERGLAAPGGRGEGESGDDLYALGVLMVFLILGYNPVEKMSDDELFQAKIEQGTYATLCGKTRVPLSLLEPIRGMLSDDPTERWGIDKLELWINGRKMAPIQKKPAQRASAPLGFMGRDYGNPRILARALSQHPVDAARLIREGKELDTWLRRSLGDANLADLVGGAVAQAKVHEGGPLGSDDVLVSRVCIYLDPAGPIRYRGLAFLPEAFGPTMAVELLRRDDLQLPAEILSRELHTTWAQAQAGINPDVTLISKTFGQLKGFLNIDEHGYGIDRCLYEANPSLPCQSPLVIKDYVVAIEDLLPALDRAAGHVDAKAKPMDRHLSAFITARFNQDIQPHLKALSSPKEDTFLIGMLSLLAFLQWKLRTETLYGLSSWIGGLLGPAINTFYSRSTRREIERDIPRLVRKGSLPELFDLIDNADKRRADADGYATARSEFQVCEAEIREIEGIEGSREAKAQKTGQQSAAMSSIVFSMIIVTILFLVSAW